MSDTEAPHELHHLDRTPEYTEFIEKLRVYHTLRGTNFEPEPRVGNIPVDLLKVFNHIVSNGGYDKVSDEKLAWRRMAVELGLAGTNERNIASIAFALKEKFYKNLAAYEITTIHGKEPPPKDILEDMTAKGAGLLTRTRENFHKKLASGAADSAASGDDATPSRERPSDASFSQSTSRASRGLREAPAQRVLFQPDTGPTRSTRHGSGQLPPGMTGSPANSSHPPSQQMSHGHHPGGMPMHAQARAPRGASYTYTPPNAENIVPTAANYDPRPPMALALRPVDTPGNNPGEFRRQKQLADSASRQPMQPGTGFDGPNIYLRCLNALRSRLASEQAYALHHLVKISFERGDKYKFESFHGLAEGLVDKVLEVGSLFYDVKWTVSWDAYLYSDDPSVLDGCNGTDDILDRIKVLKAKSVIDSVQPEDFADRLILVNEAALTIRNMVMLNENALYLSDFYPVRDMICIVLSLPEQESVVELKHMALDIAEQLTPHLVLGGLDPLYTILLAQLDSPDRGVILTALRALSRISVNLDATNKLEDVPASALRNICSWLLLNDDELIDSCMDFLYQYTAVVPNVDNLLRSVVPENLVAQLVRLLSHGAKKVYKEVILVPETKIPPKDEVASMPQELLQELLAVDEPRRCQSWVRCFFEEDKDSYVTQIAAWQAYQNAFSAPLKGIGVQLITPADFIRSSTMVYKESNAQVLKGPGEMQQKFIIHGIRARPRPVGIAPDEAEFFPCAWASETKPGQPCRQFFKSPQSMWTHVITAHLKENRTLDGHFLNSQKVVVCKWADCSRFPKPVSVDLWDFARHISTHVSTAFPPAGQAAAARKARRSHVIPAKTMTLTYEETMMVRDDRANPPVQPVGIPLSAVLILRNLARNTPKTEAEEQLLKQHELGGEGGGWNERLFRPMLNRLFDIMAENKALAFYIGDLVGLTGL